MKTYKPLVTLASVIFIASCSNIQIPSGNKVCKNYNLGRNTQFVSPYGGVSITKPITGMISGFGSILDITNLEDTDMVLSYFPIGNKTPPIKDVKIPAGKSSSKFIGAFERGKIVIERKPAFFTGRGDGADIKICFLSSK